MKSQKNLKDRDFVITWMTRLQIFLNLFTGVMSENEDLSRTALNLIIKARALAPKNPKKVRKLKIPYKENFNLEATNFMELLRWKDLPREMFTEPPILMKYSIEELQNPQALNIPRLLCHSQVYLFFTER